MSKGNMLLGYSRGKVGDVVFQRLKGQQITKARNRHPNNPRTYAQMGQRVRIASCVDFYKRNRSFFPFAYQDKLEKESEYNAFVKKNIGISPFYTKTQVTDGSMVLAPFVMTYGELPEYSLSIFDQGTTGKLQYVNFLYASDIETTDESDGVIEYLPQLVTPGRMLTFYFTVISSGNGSSQETDGYLQIYNNGGEIQIEKSHEFVALGGGLELVSGSDRFYGFSFILDLPISVSGTSMNAQVGGCAVLSEKNGSKLLVSNSTMVLNDRALNAYISNHSVQHLNDAAESYGEVSSALLDPSDASRYGAAYVPYSLSLEAPSFSKPSQLQTLRMYLTPETLTAADAYIQMSYTFTTSSGSTTANFVAHYGTLYPSPTYSITIPAGCTKVVVGCRVYSGFITSSTGYLFLKEFTFVNS